ncbi:MAG: family transcriptional regulator [Burkholderiaceae bacterium]|nr:family transcriptional regulator [Burkholderiaceae bacterium]
MRQEKNFTSLAVTESLVRLGERIRRARKVRKLSLAKLEGICRIHRTTLGRLERGDPGVALSVLLTVLEALQELPDIELVLSQPETPKHKRGVALPVLDRDF